MKPTTSVLIIGVGLACIRVQGQQTQPPTQLSSEEALAFTDENAVEGQHLKAFQVVLVAFQKIPDLPSNKKRLENYTVIFKQDSQTIYIHMIPKPDEILVNKNHKHFLHLHGDNARGRDILYLVRRRDLKIINRFYPQGRG